MRRGAVLACFGAGLIACAVGIDPASAAAPAFRISDPDITEASGIGLGLRSPDAVYVQNDSGDSARFFALSSADGSLLATYDLPDTTAVDVEDLAVAADAAGTASVWLADTGDNDRSRPSVRLYRVDEPAVKESGSAITTARPDVWTLTYPDGPHDTESLAIGPDGVPYLITKALDGDSAVYAAPAHPGTAKLRKIATIHFAFTGTPGPFTPIGQLTATGAAFSPDGSRLAVRTYSDAYVWAVRGGDVAAALRAKPTRVALPYQPQGEGICFDGKALLVDSEKANSPVYRVALPAAAQPAGSPSSTPPTPPTTSASSLPPSTPAADRETRPSDAGTYALAAVAGAAALLIGVLILVRRKRA